MVLPWFYQSMDWFKGKFTGKPPYLMGKSMVSCKFSFKPIHSTNIHPGGISPFFSSPDSAPLLDAKRSYATVPHPAGATPARNWNSCSPWRKSQKVAATLQWMGKTKGSLLRKPWFFVCLYQSAWAKTAGIAGDCEAMTTYFSAPESYH